ncbi:MAG: class I SAM-dependent methyltransferase [Bacteroidota bacterium]
MKQVWRFLQHLRRSRSIYRVHSPFVFEFCQQVLPHRNSPAGKKIAGIRKAYLRDSREVEVVDFGAGQRKSGNKPSHRKLKELVKSAARPARQGELLHRICQHYKPQRCLELGTQVGLGTLYQASAVPQSEFITLEGAPALAAEARKNFREWPLKVSVLEGPFVHSLGEQLDLAAYRPDYVFLDGHHTYEATLDYVRKILPHMPTGGMLILDDIHWSAGMEKAWAEICAMEEIPLTVDLFFLGICFLRPRQAKEHFSLRFF